MFDGTFFFFFISVDTAERTINPDCNRHLGIRRDRHFESVRVG